MLRELLSKGQERKIFSDKCSNAPASEWFKEEALTKSMNKVKGGHKAKRNGEAFEGYFKRILDEIANEDNSPIVCYRKHSNEVVGALTHKKMFGLVKKLGYLKGDLDYSITLKGGKTLYVECKSGGASLSKEQEEVIKKYKEHNIPYLVFSEKDKKFSKYLNIVATRNFAEDKLRIRAYIGCSINGA